MGRSILNYSRKPSPKRQRIHGPHKDIVDDGRICCWMDYESLESIDSLNFSLDGSSAAIHTPIASTTTTEIFLNRLQQEILLPFRYSLSSQIQLLDTDQSIYEAKNRRKTIQQRILCGYNAVSNVLFDYSNFMLHGQNDQRNDLLVPRLIVLVNPDSKDEADSRLEPSMLQHFVMLTHEIKVPLLLLPSLADNVGRSSSRELATLFGANVNFLNAVAFISRGPGTQSHRALVDEKGEVEVISKSFNRSSEKYVDETIDSFVEFIRGKIAKY